MGGLALFTAVFLACCVEAVEATTIVLAAGTARDWRSALSGTFMGLLSLSVIIIAVGPAISKLPINALRLFVGGVLLVFGLQWVRKAILRSSGYKALHNEDEIFKEEVAAARKAKGGSRFAVSDWYAFTLSFKGVLLEGLEVAFIVLTFGTIQHQVTLASISALTAIIIVAIAGFVARKPLARVPENTMKFIVGIMLSSFGIFWGAEGAGSVWPGNDASLLGVIAFMLTVSFILIRLLNMRKVRRDALNPTNVGATEVNVVLADEEDAQEILAKTGLGQSVKAFGEFWYDFLIGDDWKGTVILVLAFLLTHWLYRSGTPSWWVVPVAVALLLPFNLFRVVRDK